MASIYVIGSLDNIPRVNAIADALRGIGLEAFDSWSHGGKDMDRCWQEWEKAHGHTYKEAFNSYHAKHVFGFDKAHLDRCDSGILVLPAGRSGHLELGYMSGRDKPTFILLDSEPVRYDIMYRFATEVFTSTEEMIGYFTSRP